MGHHRLDGDVFRLPAPAAGNGCRFRAQSLQLRHRWRLAPGIGLTSHAGAGKGNGIIVAPPCMRW